MRSLENRRKEDKTEHPLLPDKFDYDLTTRVHIKTIEEIDEEQVKEVKKLMHYNYITNEIAETDDDEYAVELANVWLYILKDSKSASIRDIACFDDYELGKSNFYFAKISTHKQTHQFLDFFKSIWPETIQEI